MLALPAHLWLPQHFFQLPWRGTPSERRCIDLSVVLCAVLCGGCLCGLRSGGHFHVLVHLRCSRGWSYLGNFRSAADMGQLSRMERLHCEWCWWLQLLGLRKRPWKIGTLSTSIIQLSHLWMSFWGIGLRNIHQCAYFVPADTIKCYLTSNIITWYVFPCHTDQEISRDLRAFGAARWQIIGFYCSSCQNISVHKSIYITNCENCWAEAFQLTHVHTSQMGRQRHQPFRWQLLGRRGAFHVGGFRVSSIIARSPWKQITSCRNLEFAQILTILTSADSTILLSCRTARFWWWLRC